MKQFLAIVFAAIVVVFAVLFTRALTLDSKQISGQKPAAPLAIDRNAAVARLSRAVQIRTVTSEQPDRAAFLAFLAQSYPRVHASLQREVVGEDSLLFTWKGSDPSLPPLLLMGHYDTVPVEPAAMAKWTHPPFSGAVVDGFVWGRGTLDDKVAVLAQLEATELLLAEGYRPKRTIFFAFGADEETGGTRGAAMIAKLLASRGVKLDAIVDEGGAVTIGTVEGTTKPVAVIGIAEKGFATVELSARGNGGHSSMPPQRTEVGAIAAAVDRVQSHPFEAEVRGASAAMFRWIAPELSIDRRVIMANHGMLEPLLEALAKKSNSFNAVLRTTTAPTIISGGVKDNVIPSEARAVVNFRIMPGESVRSVVDHVTRVIDDPHIQVKIVEGWEPSPVSDPETPQFRAMHRTVAQTFPDTLVTPFLVLGATDARHYASLTPNTYRFLPLAMNQKDLERVHGIDERVSIEGYVNAIRFYRTLIANWP